MFRRIRLAVLSVVCALVVFAPAAGAKECVEVFQFKHCAPV